MRVADKFRTVKNSTVGPAAGSGLTAADIIFFVAGINGTQGGVSDTPAAVEIKDANTIAANFYAVNGRIFLAKTTVATGSFIARDIEVSKEVQLNVDSFFANQPPVAEAQSIQTLAAMIDITLSCADPENEDLTFATGPGPSAGTLTGLALIVPPLVPERDSGVDCNVNPELCTQGPVSSATVKYTPAVPGGEDSFTFTCTDPQGAVGMAVVSINTPDNSPPPPAVTAVDACPVVPQPEPPAPAIVPCSADVVEGGAVGIGLDAEGPPAPALTFCILTLPSGTLTDSNESDVGSVPYQLPGSSLLYTPNTAAGTTASFLFEARNSGSCGDVCTTPNCDQATFTISIVEAIALAGEDQEIETGLNQPVQFNVILNPGGVEKSAAAPLSIAKAAAAFPAEIAGGIADTPPEDGSGDVTDVPPIVAAGVGVSGSGNPSGSVNDPTGDATPTSPSTLVWTLNGVTFDDGGTASGVFRFNAATGTATAWDITTTAGSTLGAFSYTAADSTFSKFNAGDPQDRMSFSSTSSLRQFRITPTQALTAAGGAIALDLNTGGGGSGGTECINCAPFRLITAGSISATPTASPDLTSVSLASDGTNLSVDIRFDASTFDSLATGASVYLDVDQNVSTGCDINEDALTCTPGTSDDSVGWEYRIQIPQPQSAFDGSLTAQVAHFQSVGLFSTVPFTLESDGFTLSVPVAGLGGDNDGLNFLVESFRHSGPFPSPGNAAPSSTGLDYAPDLGGVPGTAQGDLAGTVRTQIEFDISSLGDENTVQNLVTATVSVSTEKGVNDTVDTIWFVGDNNGDSALTPSDFQAAATQLNAVMPVPAGPTGTPGTFSFDVLNLVQAARSSNPPIDVLTFQGRVDEQLTGFNQGLQIKTTNGASPPLLEITTPGLAIPTFIEILSVPLVTQGTIKTLAGAPVIVGSTFPVTTTLVFTPAFGYTGPAQVSYQVTEGGVTDVALVTFTVIFNDTCTIVGRDPGCATN
ncbi:MAG: hypothetical protein O3C10_13510 [Chloroflexi bacterium]|nr:hypothetical protein [Chloroflexota bacterium]